MNISNYTSRDIEFHFKKNYLFYLSFLGALAVTTIISVILIISDNTFLSLLVSSDRILVGLINGTATLKDIFFSRLTSFMFPMLIIVLLNINFYSGLLSYFIVSYQFMIFILSSVAVIEVHGIAGIISSLLFVIPVNLIFFCVITILSVICLERAKNAKNTGYFREGYEKSYFFKIFLCFLVIFVLSFLISFIYPMIIRSSVFVIF